jgi:hypothetical protein
MTNNLWSANSPQRFWSCYPDPPSDVWDEATRRVACLLKFSGELKDIDEILEYRLGEKQFGSDRYKMGMAKRLNDRVKPFPQTDRAFHFIIQHCHIRSADSSKNFAKGTSNGHQPLGRQPPPPRLAM